MSRTRENTRRLLAEIYRHSFAFFGPRHWWPAEHDEEMIIGAVLTQNTAWKNVVKALGNLRDVGKLSLRAIDELPAEDVAQLIRPSGYFNLKAKRLKALAHFFMTRCGGRLSKLRSADPEVLREELLHVYGIGPETADSILLYALQMPVFVIDAYTRRVLSRHGLCSSDATYQELQDLFTKNLEPDVQLFNEYHAQLVAIGHRYCKPKPLCAQCPLFQVELFRRKEDYKKMLSRKE